MTTSAREQYAEMDDRERRARDRDAATNYQCRTCGYGPTWLELQRGHCPECLDDRRDRQL